MLHVISVVQWSSNLIIIAHTYSSFFFIYCADQPFIIFTSYGIAYQTLTKQFLMAKLLCDDTIREPITITYRSHLGSNSSKL